MFSGQNWNEPQGSCLRDGDGISWVTIVGAALALSLCVPIGMALLSPGAAWRLTWWAWLVTIPTILISGLMLVSQGERGFLSNSQGICMGSLLLALSFGVGYAASTAVMLYSGAGHAETAIDSPTLPVAWYLDGMRRTQLVVIGSLIQRHNDASRLPDQVSARQ